MFLTQLKLLNKAKTEAQKEDSSLTTFERVTLGCSFAPEQWSDDDQKRLVPLDGLKYIVEDLNIKEIRLGIRWDRVTFEENKIDFSYYRPYFDYCFENKVKIALNIGPIKTFRYPEDHVPEFVSSLPANRGVIKANSELALASLKYLDLILPLISEKYSEIISAIQPENEAFFRMGKHEWTMSDEYLIEVIKKIGKYFPKKKIMLNSAGRLNLNQIFILFEKVKKELGLELSKFVLGYDYYYKYPQLLNLSVIKYLDNLFFAWPWLFNSKNLTNLQKAFNFDVEVTEAQFEPWGNATSPGNSFVEFKFVLIRCLQNFNPGKNLLIRLWGIEELAKKFINKTFSQEQVRIADLIKLINNNASSH